MKKTTFAVMLDSYLKIGMKIENNFDAVRREVKYKGKNGVLYKYYKFDEKIETQDIKINEKLYNQLNTIIIRNSNVVKERKTYKLASFLKNI